MEEEEIWMIKTYRGLLADGAQEKIPLSTKDGSVGYRIVKFQIMGIVHGEQDTEHTVKIYKTLQTTINNDVNFTDSDLLAAGYITEGQSIAYPVSTIIIFDIEIFNQDIFITAEDTIGSRGINYYLELEQMKLDHTQNMSATLKAIRGSAVD